MKDFTLSTYRTLLQTLEKNNYNFLTVEEYFSPHRPITSSPTLILAILRHDVDRKPQNALRMAKLENELGIRATYYFRIIPKTFKPDIIKRIAELGHEIGYHYECLSEKNGDYEKAIKDFEKNLARLREFYPIQNIAMHGRPTSRWDSRLLWKRFNYKEYGILSEPYFDIDFNKVLYITDAGRSWNNEKINLRDKVKSKFNITINEIEELIDAINRDILPEKIMFNIHPEHWAESTQEWWSILIIRKIKNTIKRLIIR